MTIFIAAPPRGPQDRPSRPGTTFVTLIHMPLVPQSGVAHSRATATAGAAAPVRGWWIERRLAEIAQERDCVSLEMAAQALRARRVVDGEPHEWHRADDRADHQFERLFALA